jgi:hypothetical protein
LVRLEKDGTKVMTKEGKTAILEAIESLKT